ncbi:MAG: alkaline phosphatase family protein [Acidithiobacillus sp.]
MPPVSFVKAASPHSEHPGGNTPTAGMTWVEALLKAVAEGPAWKKRLFLLPEA